MNGTQAISNASNPERDIIYSDLNAFLGVANNYELVFNEGAIQNSILNILRTQKGTRPFKRSFGTSLLSLLWEPLNNLTANRIKTEIFEQIRQEEVRIVLEEVEVLVDPELSGYYVRVAGFIPRLDNKSLDFSFNLPRRS